VLILVGCLGKTPTQQSSLQTMTPPYLHYISPENSKAYIEFDYPSSWIFTEKSEHGMTTIILHDPRFSTFPTMPADAHDPPPTDIGSVIILIQPLDSEETFTYHVSQFRNNRNSLNYITPLSEYQIVIDGYNATVFENENSFGQIYTTTMFQENILFSVKNNMYTIIFTIAKSMRGSEFEKGFDYFFNSLRIKLQP
jgi:hypothetical protein